MARDGRFPRRPGPMESPTRCPYDRTNAGLRRPLRAGPSVAPPHLEGQSGRCRRGCCSCAGYSGVSVRCELDRHDLRAPSSVVRCARQPAEDHPGRTPLVTPSSGAVGCVLCRVGVSFGGSAWSPSRCARASWLRLGARSRICGWREGGITAATAARLTRARRCRGRCSWRSRTPRSTWGRALSPTT
jgi:hypothetical protein